MIRNVVQGTSPEYTVWRRGYIAPSQGERGNILTLERHRQSSNNLSTRSRTQTMTSPRGQEVVAWRQHRRHSSLSGHTIIQTDRQYKRRSFIRHTDISHKAAEAPSSVITSSTGNGPSLIIDKRRVWHKTRCHDDYFCIMQQPSSWSHSSEFLLAAGQTDSAISQFLDSKLIAWAATGIIMDLQRSNYHNNTFCSAGPRPWCQLQGIAGDPSPASISLRKSLSISSLCIWSKPDRNDSVYPRDALLARYLLWRCLSVALSVRHKSVFQQNGWTKNHADNTER